MTYNHSKFILECLSAIERQQTNFPFEVVIGDDFSTDNNLELIEKFVAQSNNPNITYRILPRKKGDDYDLMRKKHGRLYNFLDIMNHCQGKYIALIDGDDYWIDDLKLQKQVDFLEANKDITICFTRAYMLKDKEESLHPVPTLNNELIYTFKDLIVHDNFITTASAVVRNDKPIPLWFCNLPYGDLGLYGLKSSHGKIKCLDDITTVYRIHPDGLWSKRDQSKKTMNKIKFNLMIAEVLDKSQKNILGQKQQKLLAKLSAIKYPKNKLFRVLHRMFLNFKHGIS